MNVFAIFLFPITRDLITLIFIRDDAGAKDLGFPSVLCGHVSQPSCNGGGSGLEYLYIFASFLSFCVSELEGLTRKLNVTYGPSTEESLLDCY